MRGTALTRVGMTAIALLALVTVDLVPPTAGRAGAQSSSGGNTDESEAVDLSGTWKDERGVEVKIEQTETQVSVSFPSTFFGVPTVNQDPWVFTGSPPKHVTVATKYVPDSG